VAVLTCFLSDLPAAGAQTLKEIRIATSDVTSTNFSIYYAKDRRFFEREGLDPKMIIVKAEAILAALSAGELGYTTFNTSAVEATLVGMPFRLVAVANEQPVWGLVVPKSVNQVSELKGKRIGVSSFGGTIYSGAVYVLKHFGLSPKDVTFLAIGNTLTRVAALKKGAIDAAVIAAPGDILAAKEGFKILLDVGSVYRAPMGGVSTTANRINEDPAEVRKVVRAVVGASREIKNPQNRENVVPRVARVAGVYDTAIPQSVLEMKEVLPVGARALGLTVSSWEMRDADGLEKVLAALKQGAPRRTLCAHRPANAS
jgi:ABC-type nitrate/sulfonate/bicarbonate transport system substrate-binding protein